jgi:hypothetical protein
MRYLLIPGALGIVVLALSWTGLRVLYPSRATKIIVIVFLVIWLLFTCDLMMAFLG